MLDLRVVCASSSGHLHVAVDHGATGSPEAVPHQERVLHLRVGLPGLLQPLKGHGDVVVYLLRGKVEGVVIVEDDEAMETIVLGDVRGSSRMGTPDAAEDVRWCSLFRCAERVPLGALDLTLQVGHGLLVIKGARGAQLVKEGAFKGHTVGDPYYPLLLYGADRAEGLLHPADHLLRHHEAAGGGDHLEEAIGEFLIFGGQALNQCDEVRYPPPGESLAAGAQAAPSVSCR